MMLFPKNSISDLNYYEDSFINNQIKYFIILIMKKRQCFLKVINTREHEKN